MATLPHIYDHLMHKDPVLLSQVYEMIEHEIKNKGQRKTLYRKHYAEENRRPDVLHP